MKTLLSLSFLIIVVCSSGFGQAPVVTTDDLKSLEGQKWTGTLTYLDYRSNKKTSIKSNVSISRKPAHQDTWIFDYEYPDEPKANGSSEIMLTDGGKVFSGGTVAERISFGSDILRIVTTKSGTDSDKKALFRYTYSIGRSSFSIKKEVQLEGSTEWFERNEFSWTR